MTHPDRDRQRGAARGHRRRAARHRAGLAARPGPHRRQGGLRRGRVRRLLGAGRPAGRRRTADRTRWTALNACLVPAPRSTARRWSPPRGSARPDALHPVQREMAVRGGSQCGYCTPGFICSMAAEYYRRRPARRSTPTATTDTRRTSEHGPNGFDLHALSGNLCRCTGYRPIRDAAYALGHRPADDDLAHALREPAPAAGAHPGAVGAGRVRPAGRPRRGAGAAGRAPDATVVAGCTDWGVEVNLRGTRAPVRGRRRPAARAAHVLRRRTTSSRSAPR